ncbi:MAG: XdhC family protein, partial [Chloroflexi bacterium]
MSGEHEIYRTLLNAEERGEAVALVTVIRVEGSVPRHEGSKMVVRADGSIVGTIGGGMLESMVIKEALQTISDGQTRSASYTLNDLDEGDPGICGGTIEVFIEPVGISPTVLIIGMGHVGKALAEVA